MKCKYGRLKRKVGRRVCKLRPAHNRGPTGRRRMSKRRKGSGARVRRELQLIESNPREWNEFIRQTAGPLRR